MVSEIVAEPVVLVEPDVSVNDVGTVALDEVDVITSVVDSTNEPVFVLVLAWLEDVGPEDVTGVVDVIPVLVNGVEFDDDIICDVVVEGLELLVGGFEVVAVVVDDDEIDVELVVVVVCV